MSEGTTKPNGSRENMNVINNDDKVVAKKIKEYGIEFTGVIVQFSERKISASVLEENGDPINKPNDFVLASNPKNRELNVQEMLEGNQAKTKNQKNRKETTKQAEKGSKKETKNTETGR